MGDSCSTRARALLVASLGFTAVSAASTAFAQGAVSRLAPVGTPVEVVDTSERISGNATTGLVFVQPSDKIGYDRLWAYLSEPVSPKLKLKISSIDGRYYAEVEYATGANQAPGWIALLLNVHEFKFLEENYKDPMNEIAALLSDAENPRFYPVRWASPHDGAAPPDAPKDTDPLRVYMNTERAQAFVVVNGKPAYCRDASAMSGFKFNAICDVTLGDVRNAKGPPVVDAIEVFRRSGVRTLAPVTVDVHIKY